MGGGFKVLQVLGTSSSSGKSTIAMALCRYFSDLGLRVSPFKSVNMSLNSVSIEGGYEIARSQWLQAKAARVEPEKEMNPILLKPEGDGHSQVIVLGKSIGVMSYADYGEFLSAEGREIVVKALNYLTSRFDLIIAEGAGSPAEINLLNRDLANSFVSSIYGTPAVLVADIERGGVFASIYGTVSLMPHSDLLQWIIINKMRGSKELLKTGIDKIQEMTGKKIIGIMPYTDFRLPGEDSLDYENSKIPGSLVGIIKYPHMENYSDVDPLITANIGYSYITAPEHYERGNFGTIILPGSKNVEDDLKFVRESGLDRAVMEHAAAGGKVLGICGGYQMLGKEIRDPSRVQAHADIMPGLGLLDCFTEYRKEKTVRPVRFKYANETLTPVQRSGYEIHYGEIITHENPLLLTDHGPEGSLSKSGNIMGTNIHGVLEDPEILSLIAHRPVRMDFSREMEKNIDSFTKAFIENVDLDIIKRTLL